MGAFRAIELFEKVSEHLFCIAWHREGWQPPKLPRYGCVAREALDSAGQLAAGILLHHRGTRNAPALFR